MQPPYVLVGSPIRRSFLLPPFICLTLEWSSFICPALFDHLASGVPTDLVEWSLQSVGREMRRKPEDFIDLASKDHFSPIGKENETKEENNSAKKKKVEIIKQTDQLTKPTGVNRVGRILWHWIFGRRVRARRYPLTNQNPWPIHGSGRVSERPRARQQTLRPCTTHFAIFISAVALFWVAPAKPNSTVSSCWLLSCFCSNSFTTFS